jgi:hypothetical protein
VNVSATMTSNSPILSSTRTPPSRVSSPPTCPTSGQLRIYLSSSSTTGKAFHAALSSSKQSHSAPHTMSMTELMCAYSVLEYKHTRLSRRTRSGLERVKGVTTSDRRVIGQREEKNKTQMHLTSSTATPMDGRTRTYTSSQCKVMESQKQHFTDGMTNATGPNSPAGGSTLVRGKPPPTTQATAFMMSAVQDDKDGPTNANAAPSETPSPPVNPRMSFFDEEYMLGRLVPSPPVDDSRDATAEKTSSSDTTSISDNTVSSENPNTDKTSSSDRSSSSDNRSSSATHGPTTGTKRPLGALATTTGVATRTVARPIRLRPSLYASGSRFIKPWRPGDQCRSFKRLKYRPLPENLRFTMNSMRC